MRYAITLLMGLFTSSAFGGSAKIVGKAISIQGLNTCTRWGDGEDINFILVQD